MNSSSIQGAIGAFVIGLLLSSAFSGGAPPLGEAYVVPGSASTFSVDLPPPTTSESVESREEQSVSSRKISSFIPVTRKGYTDISAIPLAALKKERERRTSRVFAGVVLLSDNKQNMKIWDETDYVLRQLALEKAGWVFRGTFQFEKDGQPVTGEILWDHSREFGKPDEQMSREDFENLYDCPSFRIRLGFTDEVRAGKFAESRHFPCIMGLSIKSHPYAWAKLYDEPTGRFALSLLFEPPANKPVDSIWVIPSENVEDRVIVPLTWKGERVFDADRFLKSSKSPSTHEN